MNAIKFSKDPANFSVTYTSPSRDFTNIRDELNNDAVNINKKYGQVYVAYSGGIDSQLIARSFKDMNLDCEYVFLHTPGYNEVDLKQVEHSANVLGIKVNIITLDLDSKREEWELDNLNNTVNYISQYPFKYLSDQLTVNIPIVSQGRNEPSIVFSDSGKGYVYHNLHEAMELRFNLMGKDRIILDFPNSIESIASYYTDKNMKTFVNTSKYYTDNQLNVAPSQLFNTYAKTFVKGQYYKENELVWYTKLTGYEDFPAWIKQLDYVTDTRVFVPYWELVDFLENTRNKTITFERHKE